ncbi:MAG: glycosyltransferase family 2 protein [Bacteroidales bacterium]
MHKVSVIVPVYNAANYLDACIGSILKQDYRNFELILIDDGSKDNSLSIIQNYLSIDSRIQVFHHANHGVSYTRNRGIDLSSGDYILFIDSDDTIEPSYISDFIRPSADHYNLVIQGLNYYVDDKLSRASFNEKEYSEEEIVHLFIEEKLINHGGPYVKLYSRIIISQNNLKFRENIQFGEDLVFFLQYLKCVKKVSCISAVGYNYIIRTGSDSLTQCLNSYKSELQGLFYIQDSLQSLMPQSKYSRDIKEFITRLCYRVILSGISDKIPIRTIWKDLTNVFGLKNYFILSNKRFMILSQLFILSPRLYFLCRFGINKSKYPYR